MLCSFAPALLGIWMQAVHSRPDGDRIFQPNKEAACWTARSRYQTWVALLYVLPTGGLLAMILMREAPVHFTETPNDV